MSSYKMGSREKHKEQILKKSFAKYSIEAFSDLINGHAVNIFQLI